jgi:hypothetical protein
MMNRVGSPGQINFQNEKESSIHLRAQQCAQPDGGGVAEQTVL